MIVILNVSFVQHEKVTQLHTLLAIILLICYSLVNEIEHGA